ncbi:ZDH18 [Hepatospora eriocheir]|uniref:Palmitoyltransferase n=1 Tax=Hepatospora eriocheir TaxID=1081669 RepID=A0A1X0QHE6_9MICR|nr:ZDH18 [Hepatospora eriocheir]
MNYDSISKNVITSIVPFIELFDHFMFVGIISLNRISSQFTLNLLSLIAFQYILGYKIIVYLLLKRDISTIELLPEIHERKEVNLDYINQYVIIDARESFPLKCNKCKRPKPPRAHHCSECNKCYLKYDHHCYYFNSCIGFHNY